MEFRHMRLEVVAAIESHFAVRARNGDGPVDFMDRPLVASQVRLLVCFVALGRVVASVAGQGIAGWLANRGRIGGSLGIGVMAMGILGIGGAPACGARTLTRVAWRSGRAICSCEQGCPRAV
jgi:hypothetical protein